MKQEKTIKNTLVNSLSVIFIPFFLGACATNKIDTNCSVELSNAIKEILSNELKIDTQADGNFVFYLKIQFSDSKIKITDINSRDGLKVVQVAIFNLLEERCLAENKCVGRYNFYIKINTVQYKIDVFSYGN